mgnify:CR=1 FL=1
MFPLLSEMVSTPAFFVTPNFSRAPWILLACNKSTKEAPLFEALTAEQTGIQFENKLHPNEQFNMFHYMYYYNGAGVATGDFNNDGQADIFFASNEGDNQLYLNKGNNTIECYFTPDVVKNSSYVSLGSSILLLLLLLSSLFYNVKKISWINWKIKYWL